MWIELKSLDSCAYALYNTKYKRLADITKYKFQIDKMINQKRLRTWFQVLAFGLFIFQMQESMQKYFSGPTTRVKSQKHISETQVNL